MDAYSKFKTELNALCERGKISKELKNKLSHADRGDPGERVYSVCSDLYAYASNSPQGCVALENILPSVIALVQDTKPLAPACIGRHYDTLAAYVKLVVKANTTGAPDLLTKMSEFYRAFTESAECVRRGLPLF